MINRYMLPLRVVFKLGNKQLAFGVSDAYTINADDSGLNCEFSSKIIHYADKNERHYINMFYKIAKNKFRFNDIFFNNYNKISKRLTAILYNKDGIELVRFRSLTVVRFDSYLDCDWTTITRKYSFRCVRHKRRRKNK